jgi:hypothetical protein
VSEIMTYGEFAGRLKEASSGVRRLIAQYPEDDMLISISRQLDELGGWTAGGRPPSDEQRRGLTVGILAVRAVEDVDEELAQRIYDLAYFVNHWPVAGRR